MMGNPKEVIGLSTLYLRIYFCGMPFFMTYNYCAAILRAIGDTRRPLIFLAISGAINAGLNYILVRFFDMGVAGVAIATVVSPSNGFAYTVAGVPATKKETTYTVNETEAQKGFITIVATANSAKLYSITVKQLAFKSVIPKIKLNSAGWASFTSVLPGAVLMCPIGSTAYVATEVGGGVVTLAPVTKFTYGQGVFIKGDANSEILPVVTEGVSDVPTEGNITEGCTENVELYTESGAYIVATNTVTGEAGFFRVIGNNVVVPAGKAYLYGPLEEDAKAALSEDAKMLKIVFANGEQATGIESVIAAKAVAPTEFYNLSGQKVGKDYKGVVVGNNGVKYVK